MDLKIDINTGEFLEINPSDILLKNGDTTTISVQFVDDCEVVEVDPSATVQFALKEKDDFAGSYIAYASSWTKVGSLPDTKYEIEVNLNTTQLNDALDGDKKIPVSIELEWIEGTEVSSTMCQYGYVENDLIKTGTLPPDDIPNYPPSNVITDHINNTSNPHSVTATQVGALASGDNVSELVNDAGYITSAPVDSVNGQTGVVVLDASDVNAATTAQGNTADSALQPGANVSELTNDAAFITAGQAPIQTVNGQAGTVVLGAGDVGLGDVDNTSDANKPISAAAQSALDGKADLTGGFVPSSQIPAIAITEFLGTVGTDAAMVALVGQQGDWCLRSDKSVGYVITGADPSQLSNWKAVTIPGSAVTAVNSQIGDVVLGSADVGLGNVDNTSDADKPISTAAQSVLDAKADLVGGLITTSQIPAIAITEFLGSVANDAAMLALVGQQGDWCLRSDLAVGYVIIGNDPSQLSNWEAVTVPGSAVSSINGQVGTVVLGASDVGAATAAQGATADSALQASDIGATVQGFNADTVIDATYVATDENFSTAEKLKLSNIETGATADQTGAEIKTAYEDESNTNAFTDAEKAKLASVDAAHYLAPVQSLADLSAIAAASITDKARVFVENELSDYFYNLTATSGDVAPDDQTGGTGFWVKVIMAGETAASIKTKYESNPDTNAYTDTEKTKLSGVEAGATADQTGAEIKAAYEAEADTNSFTDAEKAKLVGVESGADATAAANVQAAGALMDSELTDGAAVKAIDQGLATGDDVEFESIDIGLGQNRVYSDGSDNLRVDIDHLSEHTGSVILRLRGVEVFRINDIKVEMNNNIPWRFQPNGEPTSPLKGTIYFDSTTNKLRCYDGTTWNDLF